MTNLAHDANLQFLGAVYTEKFPLALDIYPVTEYKGAPAMIDQSADPTGVTSQKGVTVASGDVFVGIFAEKVTVPVGQVEELQAEVYVWPTIVGFQDSNLDLADLGKPIYMSDTATLSTSSAAGNKIGSLYQIHDGYSYVLLDPPTPK